MTNATTNSGPPTAPQARSVFVFTAPFLLRHDGRPLASLPPAQLEQLVLQRLRRDAHAGQHPDGRPVFVVQYPQQDVFGAQVVVSEPSHLLARFHQHLLGQRRKWEPATFGYAHLEGISRLPAHLLEGDPHRRASPRTPLAPLRVSRPLKRAPLRPSPHRRGGSRAVGPRRPPNRDPASWLPRRRLPHSCGIYR